VDWSTRAGCAVGIPVHFISIQTDVGSITLGSARVHDDMGTNAECG
jgi:hypothetical protein